MKLSNHEIAILVSFFQLMEKELTYEHEIELCRLADCSVSDLYELSYKLNS